MSKNKKAENTVSTMAPFEHFTIPYLVILFKIIYNNSLWLDIKLVMMYLHICMMFS